ncbi:hypothetical protein T4C_8936 [Trichinella pseudospiralis]|uniref:Uncharacterized protein n=1 Tax=Trichinella pseudospiralis TaxID=6337 RepID=A0A0V1GC57_TRIPS|nr:hypothetical protein T4C_8936 [Trichinella pseudospiralis]
MTCRIGYSLQNSSVASQQWQLGQGLDQPASGWGGGYIPPCY